MLAILFLLFLLYIFTFYSLLFESFHRFEVGDLLCAKKPNEKWQKTESITFKVMEVGKKNYRLHHIPKDFEMTVSFETINCLYKKVK